MSQFFLRAEDVGKSRADAAVPRLAELNAYVPVRNLGGAPGQEITVDLIQGFQVRAYVLPELQGLTRFRLSSSATPRIASSSKSMHGLTRMVFISLRRKRVGSSGAQKTSSCFAIILNNVYSSVFNDFGPKFTCVDPTGEQPLTGMIVSVEQVREFPVHIILAPNETLGR
jgi:ubiquitin-activating enzyme E1